MHNQIKSTIIRLISISRWSNTIGVLIGRKIAAYWWRGADNKNWGDMINPTLIKLLSKKDVVHVNDIFNVPFINFYSCTGSIIEHLKFNSFSIWGSGVISDSSKISCKPRKIYAVRGPKTRLRLMSNGLSVPEIYGDPAMLFPYLYKPVIKKKWNIGVIPHYVDKESNFIKKLKSEDVIIIDVFGSEFGFIDDICSCRNIVSSSLHGLIIADAYGIPNKWIKISDKIFGNDFKYFDYYESIGVESEIYMHANQDITIDELIHSCWIKPIEIDLNKLLKSCPFYKEEKHNEAINWHGYLQ